MAETYLNLLNSAAAVSAQVYEQIDHSMSQRLNVEAQAGRFQVDAMAKAAQFAETQRMNDEQIINMRANNYMQAQRLEVEKQLMPIKLQTANLQLESQKLSLQRQQEQEGKQHFDSLTSIYDDQIGYALLQTESPEMAQEYLGYKARVSDYVSKGGKFDSPKFEEGLKAIRSKYATVQPTSVNQVEYNPQTSYLLEQISPKLAAEYGKRHPLVQGSRNSMANNFYNADDKGLNSIMSSGAIDKLYDQSEIGQLWIGRNTVQQNYANIERWQKDLDRSLYGRAQAQANNADPEALTQYDKNISDYSNQIRSAMDQNMKIFKDSSMGKYGIHTDVVPPVGAASPEQKTTDISGYKAPDETLGYKSAVNPDINRRQQQQKAGIDKTVLAVTRTAKDAKGNDIQAVHVNDTELANLDFGWFEQNATGKAPTVAAREDMATRIYDRIDEMKGKGKSIGEIVTKDKMDKLFQTIDTNVQIPISPSLDYYLNNADVNITKSASEAGLFQANDYGDKKFAVFGKGHIENSEDILAAVNKIKSPVAREAAIQELYSALNAASLTSGMTTKENKSTIY